MLDETLLIAASRAARGVTAAQAAVEDAKKLVEEAKLGVEAAKTGLSDAKAAYDAVIAEIAGAGIPASKARKAVDDMLRIFADVGIIDNPGEDAPVEPKPTRRKKAEAAAPVPAEIVEAVQELSKAGEPGVVVVGANEAAAAEPVAEVSVDTPEEQEVTVEVAVDTPVELEVASSVVEEKIAEATVLVPSNEDVREDAGVVVDKAPTTSDAAPEIDNEEAIADIFEIIETATSAEEFFVSEALVAMLNAAEWYGREHRSVPLSLDLYKEILTPEFVEEALSISGIPEEVKGGLELVADAKERADRVFVWFLHVLDEHLEQGTKHPSLVDFYKVPNEVSSSYAEPSEDQTIAEVLDDLSSLEVDYPVDPDAEEQDIDISDDETLAAEPVLVGEEVADIEEINFLDEPAADPAPQGDVSAVDASSEAPTPPRRFTRPKFLPPRSN